MLQSDELENRAIDPREISTRKPRAPRKGAQPPLPSLVTPGESAYILVPVTVRQRIDSGECVVIGDSINRRVKPWELVRESAAYPGTFHKGVFR